MKHLALLALLFLASCTSEDDTIRTLRAAGYTQIRTNGYGWFACAEEDTYATKFIAKNPAGQTASGVVCCGLVMKNCTVRF